MPSKIMPSVLDRQIVSIGEDAFGHRHYAEALKSLIESADNNPPFSIGLLGGWGTGKSSIKELYINELKNDARKDSGRPSRSKRLSCITFNAWRFGGREQDIKRALLRHVFLELKGDETKLRENLFGKTTETRRKFKNIGTFLGESVLSTVYNIIPILLPVLASWGAIWLLGITDDYPLSVLIAAIFISFTVLLKRYRIRALDIFETTTVVSLPAVSAEQYEDLLIQQLRIFKGGFGKQCERLVIFIDDLDRLSSEEMVSGLDAVRTFMEIPKENLPPGLGIVFVISCDEARVADALGKGGRNTDLPGTVFTPTDARRYLDRIFQFRLEIPPFPRQDMKNYAIDKLKGLSLPDLDSCLEKSGNSLESITEYMIHVDVKDPRNALQIVNSFAQIWWLAYKREIEGISSSAPGGLHEGAVTCNPAVVAIIAAIKVNFPDFYRDLQEQPDLIRSFMDVAVRDKSLVEQPLEIQSILTTRYVTLNEKTGLYTARQDKRSLLRFMANLMGVRWPKSLQPFLLLSEDPISRQFGDRQIEAYNDLISSNTRGVIENLGIASDNSLFTDEQTTILYRLFETGRGESELKRVNASRVIADLVARLPQGIAANLLSSLCHELSNSLDLRSQLGVERISNILQRSLESDRQLVLAELVKDAMPVGGEFKLSLPSMEPPSLEEAIGLTRKVMKIVLATSQQEPLSLPISQHFKQWLIDRLITINGKEQQIPFTEFETWVTEYEDAVLPIVKDDYPTMLADELMSKGPWGFDIAVALNRVASLFGDLWNEGELSRAKLWKLLSRYVSLRQSEAVKMAWEKALLHVSSPNADVIWEFITAFAKRINAASHNSQSKSWDLEPYPASSAFYEIAKSRSTELNDNAVNSIKTVIAKTQGLEKSSKVAVKLLDLLKQKDDEYQSIILEWIPGLEKAQSNCINYFSANIPSFDDGNIAALKNHLIGLVNIQVASADSGQLIGKLIKNSQLEVWETKLLPVVDTLVAKLSSDHKNQFSHVSRIFPNVAPILRFATNKQAYGTMLQNVFASNANADYLPELFIGMNGNWPVSEENMGIYNPLVIFEIGVNRILQSPETSSETFLESLQSMISGAVVSKEQVGNKYIEAVCATWRVAPEEADMISEIFSEISPKMAASLGTPKILHDEDNVKLLESVWSAIYSFSDINYAILVAKEILDNDTHATESDVEESLSVWCKTVNTDLGKILIGVSSHYTDSTDILIKIWSQVKRNKRNISAVDLTGLIVSLLSMQGFSSTSNTVDDHSFILEIINTSDLKSTLSRKVIENFSKIPTNSLKASAASLCKALDGKSALKHLPEDLDESDLQILENVLGGSSRITKFLNKLSKNDEQGQ